MSNMSYCRFQNTLSDLQDCYDNMSDVDSLSEAKAREQLIKLAIKIVDYTTDGQEIDSGSIWGNYLASNFEEDE